MTTDIEVTLSARANTHGDISIQSYVSQQLKDIARASLNWQALEPYKKEVVEMILHKVSRLLTGNHAEVDHYHDIAGYATLVVNRLREEQKVAALTESLKEPSQIVAQEKQPLKTAHIDVSLLRAEVKDR